MSLKHARSRHRSNVSAEQEIGSASTSSANQTASQRACEDESMAQRKKVSRSFSRCLCLDVIVENQWQMYMSDRGRSEL